MCIRDRYITCCISIESTNFVSMILKSTKNTSDEADCCACLIIIHF